MRLSIAATVLLTLAWVGTLGGAPAAEVVVRGLEVPWALAFAPDGRLYVTERPGRVRVVAEGRPLADPVATLNVATVGEAGLMGLALDPAFAQTGFLYVCYTVSARGDLRNRIVRLTVRDDRASGERILLDDLPGASIHDGCRLKFGPDGKLYATAGDAAQPALAQRRDSPAGKILRLNPDGSVPADNPFPGSPVYSLGHRNPQGLAWSRDGRLFAAEHGPSARDEVNAIRPGGNYGWPEVRGRADDPRFVDPVVESELQTWAPSGIAFLGDDLFVAALRGRRLLRISGALTGQPRVSTVLTGWGRLRDVVVGPDGALYVTTSNHDGRGFPAPDDDRILRLRP